MLYFKANLVQTEAKCLDYIRRHFTTLFTRFITIATADISVAPCWPQAFEPQISAHFFISWFLTFIAGRATECAQALAKVSLYPVHIVRGGFERFSALYTFLRTEKILYTITVRQTHAHLLIYSRCCSKMYCNVIYYIKMLYHAVTNSYFVCVCYINNSIP